MSLWVAKVRLAVHLKRRQSGVWLIKVWSSLEVVSWHDQSRLLRTTETELLVLIGLKKVSEPSLKNLDFTSPQKARQRKLYLGAPRARRLIAHEVLQKPRGTSKQLNTSHTLANIHVHESTIRRTLNSRGVHGRVTRRKPLLSKQNIAACVQFAKDCMMFFVSELPSMPRFALIDLPTQLLNNPNTYGTMGCLGPGSWMMYQCL